MTTLARREIEAEAHRKTGCVLNTTLKKKFHLFHAFTHIREGRKRKKQRRNRNRMKRKRMQIKRMEEEERAYLLPQSAVLAHCICLTVYGRQSPPALQVATDSSERRRTTLEIMRCDHEMLCPHTYVCKCMYVNVCMYCMYNNIVYNVCIYPCM
eukprot:GHVU01134086.1.p1 GENE.GHVU01134086.1~~GHVU01134086.1.p1  ORF type:complete len:154 (-),score=7.02 GHVU01134086.1:207-668(-)